MEEGNGGVAAVHGEFVGVGERLEVCDRRNEVVGREEGRLGGARLKCQVKRASGGRLSIVGATGQ